MWLSFWSLGIRFLLLPISLQQDGLPPHQAWPEILVRDKRVGLSA